MSRQILGTLAPYIPVPKATSGRAFPADLSGKPTCEELAPWPNE